MQPTFQTSFIPKKPMTSESGLGSGSNVVHQTNVFSLIATICFICAVLVSGGLFGYKIILGKQIDKANEEINATSAVFQIDKIKELIDANDRIVSSKDLLEKHVALSKLLYLFQELTVKKLRLLKLSYVNKTGEAKVTLQAESQTYNALVEQSNIFSQSDYLKNNKFSNFSLQDNGYIKVDFVSVIDTSLISYKKAIDSLSSESVPNQ